jgi:septal ring factor EnvC (AmiA/AmiB activator)
MKCHICDTDNYKYSCDHYNKKENNSITINKINKMNRQDRTELNKVISLLEQCNETIERLKEQEQEKFDNLTENLQETERGQKLEENANNLNDIFSEIESQISNLYDLINE